jgi:hypothetical protein
MSNHKAPRDVFSGVGTFLKELNIPTSNGTPNAPGKMYLSGNNLAFVDNAGIEHILADAAAVHQGDVNGSHSATKVVALQGTPVANTAPTDKQLLAYDAGSNMWRPTSFGTPNFNASFIDSDWTLVNGNYQLMYTHGLSWAVPVKPQVEIYDESTGKNLISGPVEAEVTPTQIILTSVAQFTGSVHLILPFV